MTYYEGMEALLQKNAEDHKVSTIESKLIDVIKECAAMYKDTENSFEAMGKATSAFENAINNAWKLMYLIPMIPIEDKPDKWVIEGNSPLIGRVFRTTRDTKVKVNMIERHVDTVDGTPGAIYRINANSKLAFMLYGNTIIEYNTNDGENMDLIKNYSCACYIDQFPFTVPYPSVTTIIHAKTQDADGNEVTEDYGMISDIRNISREEISAEELSNQFYSPKGTSLYPKLTPEEAKAIDATNT